MAWLNSVPVDKKAKTKPDEERITRAQKIEDKGGSPLIPPLDEVGYIDEYWKSAGICGTGAMGILPLSCHDINEWQRASGITLNRWEIWIIREMSKHYVSEHYAAEKPDCPPPYGAPEMEFDRTIVAKKVGNAFKSLLIAKSS